MNLEITPRKVVLSSVLAVFITLASFRYVFPIAVISATRGELYSLTGMNIFILLYFLIILAVVFLITSSLQKKKAAKKKAVKKKATKKKRAKKRTTK